MNLVNPLFDPASIVNRSVIASELDTPPYPHLRQYAIGQEPGGFAPAQVMVRCEFAGACLAIREGSCGHEELHDFYSGCSESCGRTHGHTSAICIRARPSLI